MVMNIDGRGRKITAELIAARRQQICDAAITVFGQKGFYNSTMDNVAESANISVGLIYKYFKDKEDLLYQSILDLLKEYAVKIPEATEQLTNPSEKFHAAIHAYAKVIDSRKRAALLGYRSVHALGRERMKVIIDKEMEIKKIISSLVDQCVENGAFKIIDSEMYTYQVIIFVNSWPLEAWRLPRSLTIEQFVNRGLNLMLSNIEFENF
jgi:hypothetical protein